MRGPAGGGFKRELFGNAEIVRHTFETLADPATRDRFQRGLNDLLAALDFTVVVCVSRKRLLLDRHGVLAVDPYLLSLGIVVERSCFELGGAGATVRIVVERRNERLDRKLTVAWDVLRLNGTRFVKPDVLRRRIAEFEFATNPQYRVYWCWAV